MVKVLNAGIMLKEKKKCHKCGMEYTRAKAYKDFAGTFWFKCQCGLEHLVPNTNISYETPLEV